ncbi:hypothetical protein FD724_40140 (plasmid) [Nostoc sp. C057]|nr:hypothetical protein FD724_40140 [Nostoc sp. C057]
MHQHSLLFKVVKPRLKFIQKLVQENKYFVLRIKNNLVFIYPIENCIQFCLEFSVFSLQIIHAFMH